MGLATQIQQLWLTHPSTFWMNKLQHYPESEYGMIFGTLNPPFDPRPETVLGEYTYEHCFLTKTTQKPKKGGAHVNMGNFAGFSTVTVDEEVGPDGRGLGAGERLAIKYENGQHCWNGPNRMTTVILGCAENDEIWNVREEEKCVYRMEVGTPAVCGPAAVAAKDDGKKDEL